LVGENDRFSLPSSLGLGSGSSRLRQTSYSHPSSLSGMYYISLIFTISVCTITTSVLVHVEKFALRNQEYEAIPRALRWLSAKSLTRSVTSFFQQKRANGSLRPFLARKTINDQSTAETETATEVCEKFVEKS
jgi:hypothetical protein